jgi:hypothetical protein
MKFLSLTPRGPVFSCLLAGSCLLVTTSGLRAADWQSLVGNTPFGQAPAASTGSTGDLEFRGVVQEEGVYLVNLYNPATKTAQWVEVNGKAPGIEVKSYDAISDKIQITQAGRSLTLPLKQAKVALLAAAPAPAAGDKPAPEGEGGKGDRRAEIRDMIRARIEGGGGAEGAAGFMRNMPPEAQAMIEEFRRRRAEGRGGDANAAPNANGGNGQQNRRQR